MNIKLGIFMAAIALGIVIIYDLLLSKLFAKVVPSAGFGFEKKTMQ